MMKELFEKALGIEKPWFIDNLKFDIKQRRLDIYINFEVGSKFKYVSEEEGISGTFGVYDTVDKTWRHLNFFQHECYLHSVNNYDWISLFFHFLGQFFAQLRVSRERSKGIYAQVFACGRRFFHAFHFFEKFFIGFKAPFRILIYADKGDAAGCGKIFLFIF